MASSFSSQLTPDFSKLLAGNHLVESTVTTDVGCTSDLYSTQFTVKPVPEINIDANDGCVNKPVLLNAQQTDALTTVDTWQWNFGDNLYSSQKNTQHIYVAPAAYPVQLTAMANNGCVSSASKNILIKQAHANAGNDFVVAANTSFQLSGSGGSSYSWLPATGLSNPGISNPVGSINNDIRYLLTITTPEGCTDTASVKITVFKGSAVYVPTAFSPNNDGLNDVLKPSLIGIKTLDYFIIYNRWGQKIFSTSEMNKGWDGFYKGMQMESGTFVWVLKAIDQIGKSYNLKGSFILLR